ncbi:MAG: PIN domain-containing protein [Candidatus Aenigmarchaeota archaeon]|nr:PIN domain-containing protein [Candidatus Aenigmarchaeota archaeon]
MDLLSGNLELAEKAEAYLRNSRGVVSSVLLAELAFHVSRRKRSKAAEILFYVQSLPNIEVIGVDEEIAGLAGLLRSKYRGKIQKKLTYFDCLHLATAMQSKCKKFITGDRGFREITDIEVEVY